MRGGEKAYAEQKTLSGGELMMERKAVTTSEAPIPKAPYSQAIIANGFVFVSGQVAI
ncbi:MAG: hypothetical protein OGMRLDGQ_003105, partial [Candidatus Fervidibacter sp.]